ncbi:unnamed protein product, partial [Phaeothamnion confervicola]
ADAVASGTAAAAAVECVGGATGEAKEGSGSRRVGKADGVGEAHSGGAAAETFHNNPVVPIELRGPVDVAPVTAVAATATAGLMAAALVAAVATTEEESDGESEQESEEESGEEERGSSESESEGGSDDGSLPGLISEQRLSDDFDSDESLHA